MYSLLKKLQGINIYYQMTGYIILQIFKKVNAESKELLFDNIEKNKIVNKKIRKQKQEKAFNDPKTHAVDEFGNIMFVPKNWQIKNKKRVVLKPSKLDL